MTIPGTALYWHRQDLRLADNPALMAASEYTNLIIVFVYEPLGRWPRGAASNWWLHHSLAALAKQYEALGQQLIIIDARAGGEAVDGEAVGEEGSATADRLQQLVGDHEVTAVFWNRRYDQAAIARDKAIKARLTDGGVTVQTYNSHLLGEPWQHNKADGSPYKVFTPLWRRFRSQYEPPALLPAPRALPVPAAGLRGDKLADLGLLPTIPWAKEFQPLWQPGEQGASKRLAEFLADKLAGYGEKRDLPAIDHCSGLSPHLHFGEISPREIWQRCEQLPTQAEGEESADRERFLSELVWREFAYHLLYHYPEMAERPWKEAFERFPWRSLSSAAAKEHLRAWQKGRTGVPLVDAGMRQLWRTGTMHNRVRMVVGSYLTKNLRMAWQQGAQWFWDTLVDADLAANSFNWQWVAGSGADAAPYFRIFNPLRQGERFDPAGVYVRQWVPELSDLPTKHIHAPWEAPAEVLAKAGVVLGQTYPRPLVDLKKSRAEALEAYQDIK